MNISRRHFISGMALAAVQLSVVGQTNAVRFAVIGDMGTGKLPQYEVARQMVKSRKESPFDFVLTLGDNMYGGHTPRDYEEKFEQPYKELLDAGVQFYASLGNHDSPSEQFYKPFNMNGLYYTYKKGNVQFFALDTTYLRPEQLTWLEKELRNSSADWKICYFHHALYSSGRFHGPSTEIRQLLEPLFVKYGVQVVFAGHEHVYERTNEQKGITYFTEGSSGELRKGNLKKTSVTSAGYDQDCTFMIVEISGDDMKFQAITRTGKSVDSGVIRRATQQAMAARQRIIEQCGTNEYVAIG